MTTPAAPRRTPLARALTAASVAVGLTATFAAGWALAPRGDAPAPAPAPAPSPAAAVFARATDLAATDCAGLLDSYVRRARTQVGPWGWEGGYGGDVIMADAESGARDLAATSDARTTRATSNEAGTNVQESGVDEPDVVKVDGDRLVRVVGRTLSVWEVGGKPPRQLGEVVLDGHADRADQPDGNEFLLVGGTAVVVGHDRDEPFSARVSTVDVSDPADPEVTDMVAVTRSVSEARLHGGVVRLVIDKGQPELDFVHPRWWRGTKGATRRNQSTVEGSALSDWLPTVDGEPVVACDRVAVPDDDESPVGSVVVSAFAPGEDTLSDPSTWTSSGLATRASATYVSADRLYVASGALTGGLVELDCWRGCGHTGRTDGRTRVDAFELAGTGTTWVAGGTVDGSVADRWSMDAVDGSLRVAVGATQATGDFNSVLTLREQGTRLVEDGRVDKLGPREQIKAVRWFDDLAVVVTFRRTDPLYAVDLSDPSAPRLLGELKIPGFSEYLHPLGSMRMIGVGQDADPRTGAERGAQAALFDVHDLTSVRRLDTVTYRSGSRAGAGTDPRQFTWLPDGRTALTVVSRGWGSRTGWVSVLTVRDGRLHNRMVEVDHGSSVDRVRTVPLPSGGVALVTDDGVSLLDL